MHACHYIFEIYLTFSAAQCAQQNSNDYFSPTSKAKPELCGCVLQYFNGIFLPHIHNLSLNPNGL